MLVTFLALLTFVRTLFLRTNLSKAHLDYQDLDVVMQRLGLENDYTNEPSMSEKLTHGY